MDSLTQKLVDILISTVEDGIDCEEVMFGDVEAIKNVLEEAKKAGYTVSTTFEDLEESVLEVNVDAAGNSGIKLAPIHKEKWVEFEVGKVDIPSGNGRTYSREFWEELQKALKYSSRNYYVYFYEDSAGEKVDLRNVVGCVSGMRIVDDKVLQTIQILDTPKGQVLERLLSNPSNLEVSIWGEGMVDKYNKVCVEGYAYLGTLVLVKDKNLEAKQD